jgi:Cys-tRNA(Pro)/Cys-tRNA(Cys) deacylase
MRDSPTTQATLELDAAGVAFRPRPYEHGAGTDGFGLEAAAALGVEPERVFKTLLADVDGDLVVAIVPVTARLQLKSLAAAVGGKRASMADPQTAERRTGYVVGGISPIGQKRRHPTVIDESAELFDRILVSGGRRGFDIELAPADLVRVTSAVLADIAR